MRFLSLALTRGIFSVALLLAATIALSTPASVKADAASIHTSECPHDRGFLPAKIDSKDPVRMIKISLSGPCCGHTKPNSSAATTPTTSDANVDVQYCHSQIINNVPISFCYWNHLQEHGTLHPDQNCCEVTLKDVDGRTYCVPAGKTLVIGPIIFGLQAKADEVPPAPPITTVESIEGGRTVIRVIPERRTEEERSDVYVYSGNRLFIVNPSDSNPNSTEMQSQ